MRPLLLALPLACGCSAVSSRFDGTWLFMIGLDSALSGDCADNPGNSTYTGTSNQVVDIYDAEDKQLVILFSEILTGTRDGSTFAAEWAEEWEGKDRRERYSLKMEGELDGGVITGTVQDMSLDETNNNTWVCTETYDFTAERVTSDSDQFVGE